MFPAKFEVIRDAGTLFFTKPEDVWRWLETEFPEGASGWDRAGLGASPESGGRNLG